MPSILGRLFGGGIIPAVEGTLAAPVLQRDVRLPLRTADRFGVTPHRDQGPDWHIVGAKVVEAPTLPTDAWSPPAASVPVTPWPRTCASPRC